MFQIGSTAVERLTGQPGVYFCPICGGPFDEAAAVAGILTEEHVPPRSLGGSVIALTCCRCNSKAGHTIEAALHRREQNRAFAEFMQSRRDEYPRDVGIRIGETEVTIKVERDPDTNRTELEILDERNDPAAVERVAQELSQLASDEDATGTEFLVRSKVRYDPRLAKVADLKAAFLTAFAVFGFRYALSPALLKVRRQIWAPGEDVLGPAWSVHVDTEQEHLLVINHKPEYLVVKLGSSGVVLPWVSSNDDFYERLRAIGGEDDGLQVQGTPMPWPTGLRLLLDELDDKGRKR